MKSEKGQVTIFILVGIVLLICVGMLFYIASVKMKSIVEPEHGKEIELISERDSLSDHVTTCLRRTVIDAYYEYGFQDPGTMESYVNLALRPCMDFSRFERPDMRITATDYYANVDVTDKAVFADITMTITVRKGDSLVEFSGFNYYLSDRTEIHIKMDADMVKKEIHLTSSDGHFDCIVPAGTKISGLDEKKISIELMHSNDPQIYGYIVYSIEPDGVSFSPSIDCTLIYDDRYWPNREEDIKIGLWVGDDFEEVHITDRDTEQNIISFEVSHFSEEVTLAPECNKKGIFTLLQDTDSLTYYCNNIEWAHEMAGTSGWITQIAYTDKPDKISLMNYFVNRAIYRELWPILRLETSYDGTCWRTPLVEKEENEDGDPIYIADADDVSTMVNFVKAILNLRYAHVLNEQNLAAEFNDCVGLKPEEYAAYYLAVAEQLHEGDNKFYVMNGPIARVGEEACTEPVDEDDNIVFCTKDWIRRMFNSNSAEALKEQIDIWASNSYPYSRDSGESAPGDDAGIKWYEQELNWINQQFGFLELNASLCWERCRESSDPESELNPDCDKGYFSDCKRDCVAECTGEPDEDSCITNCLEEVGDCELDAWEEQCTDEKLWDACSPENGFCENGVVFEKNVIIPETGYNIKNVGEDTAASYMVEAYGIWGNDPKVIGATPFILWDPTGVSGWTDFEWVERPGDYSISYKQPLIAVKDYEADPICEHISWVPEEEEFDVGEQQEECPLMPTGPEDMGNFSIYNISPGDFHGEFDYCNYCDIQNKFGIHTFFERYSYDEISAQMDKVHELTGDCGWFKQYVSDVLDPGMMDKYAYIMNEANARKLIPVLRLEQHGAAIEDYEAYTNKMINFINDLQSATNSPVYFVEILNEPNLETQLWSDQERAPQMYAEFFITAAEKINDLFPHIIVLNGGLAPGIPGTGMHDGKYIHTAEDFINGMFDYNDGQVGDYITVWASHVYFHAGGDETYKSELNVLEGKMGRRPQVMITEGGCVKGGNCAPQMVDAYHKWLSDSNVAAIMPYSLVCRPDWTEFNWIEGSGTSYTNNLQYDAIKHLREITELPTCE